MSTIIVNRTQPSVTVNNAGTQGPPGADSGISYQNVAALRALGAGPAAGTRVDTRGYASNGDGGGGVWWWDDASTATDDGGTVVKITAETTGRWKRLAEGPALDIRWFGAACDGTTDDLAAINTALAAAPWFGIKAVRIPAGVTIVKPSGTTTYLKVPNGVALVGDGPESILRVASNTGDYKMLISGSSGEGSTLDNFVLRNMTIDQNPSGNTGADVSTASGHTQFVVYLGAAERAWIDGVQFRYCCGINTVYIGDATNGEATVSNCHFYFDQATAVTPNYDNSAIYLTCKRQIVTDNYFYADVADHARGCCELHGAEALMVGNVAEGYRTICNIVTQASGTEYTHTNSILVADNTLTKGLRGVTLWSLTNYTMRNIVIANNVIEIDQVAHDVGTADPTTFWGIGMLYDAGSGVRGHYDGIQITDNLIRFVADTRATTVAGTAFSTVMTAGLCLNPYGNVSNITVRGNTVQNAPMYGMILGNNSVAQTTRNAVLTDNTFTDCGSNGTLTATVRIAVRLGCHASGTMDGVIFNGLDIRDTGATLLGSYGVHAQSLILGTVSGIRFHNVRQWTRSGTAFTNAIDRTKISDLYASATLDFGSIAAGATAALTITLLGANTADVVVVNPNGALPAGIVMTHPGRVSAADTVTVELTNITAGAIDPASKVYYAMLLKPMQSM